MDISMTLEELGAPLAETAEESAGGDAALQDGPAGSPGTVSGGDAAGAAGNGMVYVQTADMDGQLEVLCEQVEYLDYILEDELLPALQEQTIVMNNGFLAFSLIGGLLCGMFLILLFVNGRR